MRSDGWRPEGHRGEIDFFGVYCPPREEVYLVPVGDVPERAAHLRLALTRNGQVKGVRWAVDYRLGREVKGAGRLRPSSTGAIQGEASDRLRPG